MNNFVTVPIGPGVARAINLDTVMFFESSPEKIKVYFIGGQMLELIGEAASEFLSEYSVTVGERD